MSSDELNSLIAHLGAYALRRSRWLGMNPQVGGALPGGETVESIVSMAFEKLLSGRRRWDRKTYPALEEFLKSVIRSDLEHLAKSNRRLVPFSCEGPEDMSAGELFEVDSPPATPQEILLVQERRERDQAALDEVVRQCQGDPAATEILRLMRHGYGPGEIAQKMGVLSEMVYSTCKRIRRVCVSVGEQLREHGGRKRGATNI